MKYKNFEITVEPVMHSATEKGSEFFAMVDDENGNLVHTTGDCRLPEFAEEAAKKWIDNRS